MRSEEVVANGLLVGGWEERGSSNQAGSILATAYDADLDAIYAIADGGSLFKGDLTGNWEVVNQDLRFSGRFIKILDYQNGKRMFAMINKIIHYSDDLGRSWNRSLGLDTPDNWGTRFDLHHVTRDGVTFLYQRVYYWDGDVAVAIFKSEDMGQSFYRLPNLSSFNEFDSRLAIPINDQSIYLMERQPDGLKLYELDLDSDKLKLKGESHLNFRLRDLDAVKEGGKIFWYIYDESNQLLESIDFGKNWTTRGMLPERPWRDGLFISPSNPDQMLFGEVEAFRSKNRGKDWDKINNWGEYYSDVEHKLHADIMSIEEYRDPSGAPFLLIGNHGGVSVSFDYGNHNDNLGLEGLTVSQYYSVRTDPLNHSVIYAGSQDQGFQRTTLNHLSGVLEFEQVISGDYGHIVFTGDEHLWAVYPDGWLIYLDNPAKEGISLSFQMEYPNQAAWIPPLVASPYPGENAIFMLGGSMSNVSGSQIIKLEQFNNSLKYTELPFDFNAYTGEGYLTALAFAPNNPDIWYSTTSNGYFLVSEDGGSSWNERVIDIPGAHYLYGSKILVSNLNPGHLYVGGSGYSGPAMLFTDDHGQRFESVVEGLPPTVILDLAFNEDETMIFAATEAGPFVYFTELKRWADLSGYSAPTTTYWSVEYLAGENIVRFGTYGRGIFDFHLSGVTSTSQTDDEQFTIFPNPVTSSFSVNFQEQIEGPMELAIYSMHGKQLLAQPISTNQQINIQEYTPGAYLVRVFNVAGNIDQSRILIKK